MIVRFFKIIGLDRLIVYMKHHYLLSKVDILFRIISKIRNIINIVIDFFSNHMQNDVK